MQRPRGRGEHKVIDEPPVAPERLRAHPGEGGLDIPARSPARSAPLPARASSAASRGAARSSRCATSGGTSATTPARRACRADPARRTRPSGRRRAPPPAARSARSAPRRRRASSGARRGTAARDRAPGRSARARAHGARAQLQVGAAEGDDARVGVAPAATASRSAQAPAQKIACAASVVPWAWTRRSARAASSTLHSTAGHDAPASLEGVLGVGARHRAEVGDAGVGGVQPGDPARVRLELLIRRRRRGAGRERRWRARGARAPPGGRARRASVAMISFPQRSLAISRGSQ